MIPHSSSRLHPVAATDVIALPRSGNAQTTYISVYFNWVRKKKKCCEKISTQFGHQTDKFTDTYRASTESLGGDSQSLLHPGPKIKIGVLQLSPWGPTAKAMPEEPANSEPMRPLVSQPQQAPAQLRWCFQKKPHRERAVEVPAPLPPVSASKLLPA